MPHSISPNVGRPGRSLFLFTSHWTKVVQLKERKKLLRSPAMLLITPAGTGDLAWNILIKQRAKFAGKRNQPGLSRIGCFARPQGRRHANQRAITAVKANSVSNQAELSPVFAGNGTIMRQ